MSAAPAPLLRFSLGADADLSLHPDCVVYRATSEVETLPLAAVLSVRVAFERDDRRVGWGIALVFAAAVLFLIAGPLGRLAASAATEVSSAGGHGVARALELFFHVLAALAAALPVISLVCAAGGGMLAALGWRGATLLTFGLPGSERTYSVRGHNAQLTEFAELVTERILKRGA
jgi:hypothetical protein